MSLFYNRYCSAVHYTSNSLTRVLNRHSLVVPAEVTSFAGSGESGFVDDVGTKAQMTNPQQLEIDSTHRRLFLSDTVS